MFRIPIIKIVLSLFIVLGLKYLGLLGYSLTDSIGCLAGPLWDFSYVFDICIMLFWFFPIMIYSNMKIRTLILLAILNVLIIVGVFYGVAFFYSEMFYL